MEPCSETKAPVTKTKAPVTMNRVSIFLFSLPLPCSAFHLSILSEVWLLNFLRIDGMSSETHWRTPSFFKAPPTRWWYMCRGLKFTHGISIICISGVWSFIPQFVNPEKMGYGFTRFSLWIHMWCCYLGLPPRWPNHEKRSLQGEKQHKTTTSNVSWPQVAWNCNVVNPTPDHFGRFTLYTIHFWFNWRWLIVFEYWVISGLPHYLPTRTWVLS